MSNAETDQADTSGDISRRATVVDEDWESIGGKYFYEGSHVPLDERPENLVGPLEEPFQNEPGIHDVTVCAGVITVYASGWDDSDIHERLNENTSKKVLFTCLQSLDNTFYQNCPQEANKVVQFKLRAK